MSTAAANSAQHLIYWHSGSECCDAEWEAAYARFETPQQEIAKFVRRLRQLGVHQWPKTLRIAELFCGRGNGLVALEKLGFSELSGVDLAPSLLRQYGGPGRLFVGDCRDLQFDDGSLDAVIIQGGLHHLPQLPADLARVLQEIDRVLCAGGRVIIVEPWLTPFLRAVHMLARRPVLRRLSRQIDALQEMIDREQTTYAAWLAHPRDILSMLNTHFETDVLRIGFGKLMFSGRKARNG